MIEHENDPVWTPLSPADGEPWWCPLEHREPLRIARDRSISGGEGWPVARWDAEAVTWVVAPPAPAEVTGVPRCYQVVDAHNDRRGSRYAEAEGAWALVDNVLADLHPEDAPFSVEACIPVPRNEANDG